MLTFMLCYHRCVHLVQGPISLTVFPSQFQFDGNFVSLSSRFWYSDHYKILYMARQLCCRGMCKNLLWSDSQQRNYSKAKFPSNWNCRQKIVSETGPRSRNCGCLITWFCYQLIAKPGNTTAAVSWPDPYTHWQGTFSVSAMSVRPEISLGLWSWHRKFDVEPISFKADFALVPSPLHNHAYVNACIQWFCCSQFSTCPLQWCHNEHDGVSNHQPHDCLPKRLFRRKSKKTSKLRVTGLCVGNSPGPVNSPHKWPVMRKVVPFDDVIMFFCVHVCPLCTCVNIPLTCLKLIQYYNMVRWISAPGTMHFRPRYDTFWPCGLFTLLQFCNPPQISMKLRWVSSVN